MQATAWYLQLDIWIVSTSSTESSPYIVISGNLGDGIRPSDGPIITLGTKSNCHYQSLLPIEIMHLEFQQNQQDPDYEITLARQNFNQMKDHEKTVHSRENPSNRTADLEQDELENKVEKKPKPRSKVLQVRNSLNHS